MDVKREKPAKLQQPVISEGGRSVKILLVNHTFSHFRTVTAVHKASVLKYRSELAPTEDNFNFHNIARFYPDSKATFYKHVTRISDEHKAFAVENAGGQRIFVVASDEDAPEDLYEERLQRVVFVQDLSILGG